MEYTPSIIPSNYDDTIKITIPFYSEILDQITDIIRQLDFGTFNLLDIGCGTGSFAKLLDNSFLGNYITLCDNSADMLSAANEKLSGSKNNTITLINEHADSLTYNNEFDVITSIHMNHFFRENELLKLIKKLYIALKPGGVLISVQNTAPDSDKGRSIAMGRWKRYLLDNGRTKEQTDAHQERYGINYFPLTLSRQYSMLHDAGFVTTEQFWSSYLQTGIYAIKES